MKISASILSADFLNLEKEIDKLIENKIEILHCDVMDGSFVPNISFGECVISKIHSKYKGKIIIDTHLMIKNPEKFLDVFLKYSDVICFHFESTDKHLEIIEKVKSNDKKVGIAIKPSTQKDDIKHLLPYLDYILIMTVEPGFAGQKFLLEQIEKIKEISNFIKDNNLKTLIQVDGGVNDENIKLCKDSGVEIFCMAKYIFQASDLKENIAKLEKIITS